MTATISSAGLPASDVSTSFHVCRAYPNGIGHIEVRDGLFMVSFYGRRVVQSFHVHLQTARATLRRVASTGSATR